MKHRCPVCKKIVKMSPQKPGFFPFCSERCKLIDLGAWLDAKYRIPLDSRPQNTHETPPDTPDKTDTEKAG